MNIKFDSDFKEDIHDIKFNLNGIDYKGNGEITWNYKQGFKLIANVKPLTKLQGQRSFGGPRIISRTWIYFRYRSDWRAIIPNAFLDEWSELQISLKGKIEIEFPRLIVLSQRSYILNKNDRHFGKILFTIKENTRLPNRLKKEIKIDDVTISNHESMGALAFDNDKLYIRGRLNENNLFEVDWKFLTEDYCYKHEWLFPMALRTTLSICFGQLIEIVGIELNHHYKTINTYSKYRKPLTLGYFSPLNVDNFDYDLFELILFNQLEMLKYHSIISNIFYWIADAYKIGIYNLWGFNISSILEAILRTYENKPFKEINTENKWKFNSSLSKIRNEFFSKEYCDEYKKIFKDASKAYKTLRNRNAHPDWVNNRSFAISEESYQQTLLLINFYGYLLKALCGAKLQKP